MIDIYDYIESCRMCHGTGKRHEAYGKCQLCKGMRYLYRNTANAIPISVLNQIGEEPYVWYY